MVSSESLLHYGIKGMRWGVRKDTVSSSDKKAANANLKKQLANYEKNTAQYHLPMSTKKYNSLSKEEVKIAKGKEIVRITTRKDEKLQDITYGSHTNDDVTVYRSLIPTAGAYRFTKQDYNKSYEHVFEATKTLRGPSEKARVDAFIELLNEPILINKDGSTMTGSDYLKRNGFSREVKQLNSVDLGLSAYKTFVSNQPSETPLNTAYFEKLKSRGYNIVSDDNDRGLLSKDPIIIMDTSQDTLRPKSVRQLTKQDVVNAQQSLMTPTRFGIHE